MAVGRKFGHEASIYLAGFVGAGILQFLAIPVYSRALGPDQYGLLTLTIATATVLSGVMILGGDVALARFWVDAPTEESKRSLASTWIGFLTAWSAVVALIAIAAAPWLADRLRPGTGLAVLLVISIAGLVPAQISRMLAQILRNRFRPTPYALTTVLTAALNVGLGVLFGVAMGLGVLGIVLGTLTGESLGALIRLPLVWSSLEWKFSGSTLRPLLRFGIPFVPASVATWVFTGADRLVIGASLHEAQLGAYGLAAAMIGPFTVFTMAMGQAWLPRIAQLNAHDPDSARATAGSAVGLALGGLGAAAIAVGALAPWLVGLVGGSDYARGADALPFLALGSAFAGTALFTATGLTLAKRTSIIPVVTIASAAVDVALLLVLVPRVGLVGASISVAAAYLTLSAGALYFASRVFPLKVDPPSLAITLLVLVVQSSISTVWAGSPWVLASAAAGIAVVVALSVYGHSRVRDGGHWTAQQASDSI